MAEETNQDTEKSNGRGIVYVNKHQSGADNISSDTLRIPSIQNSYWFAETHMSALEGWTICVSSLYCP